ncbi:hypothetical protein [Flavobacterium sp. AED]|uniref:hypothetical protein n=1 Tax=Flavobacterium sp. AED TaxID=1423323 RepID=UPI00057C39C2|nr:hypothetical protein [Flavobacterium sp. AED]KIA86582.1 hypothetical protein OA85_02730 [Flavobacterium sp. AED]
MAFNSRQYEWADLTLILGGRDVTGFRGIKYSEKIEREAIFAKGRDAHSIQSGNSTVEGEITLLQSEYEALVKSGKGSVLSLSLDALVAYGNPANADPIITDRLLGIRFTESAKELKQGDKMMEITLPFIALRVQNQV